MPVRLRSFRKAFSMISLTFCWLRGHTQDSVDYRKQRDLIDLAMIVLRRDPSKRLIRQISTDRVMHLSASPIVEYTVATGWTGGLAAGGAFLNGPADSTNVSSFVGAIKYTQRHQFLLPIESSIWTNGNKWNFPGDWRYLRYPQDTYGIGGHTTQADGYTVSYQYARFYEYALKHLGGHWYGGFGYQFDHHWEIRELNVPPGRVTDYDRYGFSPRSTSSGVAFDIQYDSRQNSINPAGGSTYANIALVQNLTFLGSNTSWNSLLIDLRKYFSAGKRAIMAFWLYGALGLGGKAPYLDLPGTGTDTYNNTGRGYEQDRYIGKRYIDLEAEYRFPIARNGLVGGVLFANAGSVSEFGTTRFEVVFPGVGVGLRIKFNKFSNTNACLDYGLGTEGSRGLFGNLGEVF